ncbi:MAG: His/Gly/Thr/Pro-type tRNA ligase C-terminal domain-containing protein, partial [Bacillota bacterium]
ADLEIKGMSNFVVGGNAEDLHLRNVNIERDFKVDAYADLRNAVDGDPCPRCKSPLTAAKGTEVGHIFKLGTKYSEALGAKYLDENGEDHLIVMGSYGIGITRTVAAIIESNHDEDGIIWPMSVAPYHAVVVPINVTEQAQNDLANEVYERLNAAGVEAVLDDRDERPGVKFKDADLIGYPIRIVVGPKTLKSNQVEVKLRKSKETQMVDVESVAEYVTEIIRKELEMLMPK